MKIKTSEATPRQLNWLVAKIEGWLHFDATGHPWDADNSDPDGEACWFEPAVNWAQGGPIIEREKVGFQSSIEGDWMAFVCGESLDMEYLERGHTPLIAAMRCYVASKLGDEVEIPKELK